MLLKVFLIFLVGGSLFSMRWEPAGAALCFWIASQAYRRTKAVFGAR